MATNKCIILNNVEKNENAVTCLARVDNYWNLLKRITVGESITTSEPIDLHFIDSIGASKWMLIFYPKGQYNAAGMANGYVSVYLLMLSCDNHYKSLKVNVKVFFKSPYFEMKDEYCCTKTATFMYEDVKKRWIGPFDLIRSKDLCSSRCRNLFTGNGTLTIGCEMVVIPLSSGLKKVDGCHVREANYTTYRSPNRRNDWEVMDSQLESKNWKSYNSCHTSTRSFKLDDKGKSTKNITQDWRTWSEKLLKQSDDAESNNENMPPNDQNIKSKVPNMTKSFEKMSLQTYDSNEKSPNVGKLVDFFEKFSQSHK